MSCSKTTRVNGAGAMVCRGEGYADLFRDMDLFKII